MKDEFCTLCIFEFIYHRITYSPAAIRNFVGCFAGLRTFVFGYTRTYFSVKTVLFRRNMALNYIVNLLLECPNTEFFSKVCRACRYSIDKIFLCLPNNKSHICR